MSNSFAKSVSMNRAKEIIGNLAQTNQYFVQIAVPGKIKEHLGVSYKDNDSIITFAQGKLGFFCSEATLPVSSYATAEVKDNFMGVTQEFAHTRLYTDMDMTFYVDDNYDVLRFFEGWMDYISGAGEVAQRQGNLKHYYRRFAFPDDYKVDTITIVKFERQVKNQLIYQFVNAFPKGLTSIPVSYGPAELLKVTVTFNFDRYIVGRDKITPTTNPLKPDDPQINVAPGGPQPGIINPIEGSLLSADDYAKEWKKGFARSFGDKVPGSFKSEKGQELLDQYNSIRTK